MPSITHSLPLSLLAMTANSVTPRRRLRLFVLVAVAGGAWCQTLLDPEPRTCRTKDNAVAAADAAAKLSQGRRNEYPAGGMLMVLARVPAGLFGSLQVYLCPDGEAEEECLDRVPLQLADGSGTSYDLRKVPGTNNYEIPVILPDNVTCSICTLQVRVLNRDCEDEEACPAREETTCADITVREIKSPEERSLHDVLDRVEDICEAIEEGKRSHWVVCTEMKKLDYIIKQYYSECQWPRRWIIL